MDETPVLCIDFGTTSTCATLRYPNGSVVPVRVDGQLLMPSAIADNGAGRLVTGRAALELAREYPERCEPHPKRHLHQDMMLLGTTEHTTLSVVATILRRVLDAARDTAGAQLTSALLTHPENWGRERKGILLAAGKQAGLADIRLMSEPVAALHYLIRPDAHEVPIGAPVAVCDLGGGTFDVTVARRTGATSFAVIATGGLPNLGGVDIDQALLDHLSMTLLHSRHADTWRDLTTSTSETSRRAIAALRDDLRRAKEAVSETAQAFVTIPALGWDAPISRETVMECAQPTITQIVIAILDTLRRSGIQPDTPGLCVLLVGGATRMPLVATMLHQSLGFAPRATPSPENVVSEGGAHAAAHHYRPVIDPGPELSQEPAENPVSPPDQPRATGRAAPLVRRISSVEPGGRGDPTEPHYVAYEKQ